MQHLTVDYLYKIPDFFTGVVEQVSAVTIGNTVENQTIKTLWYVDGMLHREDKPAVLFPDGTEEWWLHGERHRTSGPAILWPDHYKEWWQDGVMLYNSRWVLDSPNLFGGRQEFPLGDHIVIERDIISNNNFAGQPLLFTKILTQSSFGYIPALPGL